MEQSDFRRTHGCWIFSVPRWLFMSKMPPRGNDSRAGGANSSRARDWRFWLIFAGLSLASILVSIESTIVATALPTISADLGTGNAYIWVTNIYFLTRRVISFAIFQPLYGQFADLWGRRKIILLAIFVFMAASAICGAAQNTAMLIIGRGIQGVGGGGIIMLANLIICDLVPLSERSRIAGLLFALVGVSSCFGPLIGGALAGAGHWRFAFYFNVPIGAISLAIIYVYLRVSHRASMPWQTSLRRIDYAGTLILVASTVLVLYALSYAGFIYQWSDPRIIALLAVGLVLLLAFVVYEHSPRCSYPSVPPILFQNRTSSITFFITFNHAIVVVWVIYFFPLFFQSVLGTSPGQSGLNLLVLVLTWPVFASLSGVITAKTGQYKFIQLFGLSILSIGVGCCSLLDQHSTTGMWVGFLMLIAAGLGTVFPALLPAVQAELSEEETASSTAAWALLRGIGMIWGVSIPAAIFNNRIEQLAGGVDDPIYRKALTGGRAYEHGTAAFLNQIQGETKEQIVGAYVDSLKLMWLVCMAFPSVSTLAALFERRVKLRKELVTDFGFEEKSSSKQIEGAGGNESPHESSTV
ncbi:hypothetical protein KVR01_011749 [Diaporthe batatas]|uniref:uncharacterized protein n=1 Tax=Diaporthe batatas TaxID=748121 RepID=UPI001D05BD0D|nr:uncharacterized protein KVR01_011749 [Diaporthe batatas]KAG8158627.1 hypothetical protein KVR01_011749 [Diaporthe batatas]